MRSGKVVLFCPRFFIGYWILKQGWISILALFLFKIIYIVKSLILPN